jgi:gamma-glutamyltranspeptidase/glutathione hydrolase
MNIFIFSFFPKRVLVILVISVLSSCSYWGGLKEKTGALINQVVLGDKAGIKDHESTSNDVMVVTQGPYSTQAGIDMLEKGGNAFDAAVAVSFTMAVERPQSTGIGGGGFMLYALPGMDSPLAIDFRERAPQLAKEKMFLNEKGEVIPKKSTEGIFSVAVPGLVAGLAEIHQKYGKLSWSEVLSPAIRLAEEGFPVYSHLASALNVQSNLLEQSASAKKVFFHSSGQVLKEGDLLIQADLAKSLKILASEGKGAFYKGKLSQAILKEVRRHDGLLTESDFEDFQVKYRKPVQGIYKDYTVYSMAPPSSGGTHIIQLLNMIENDPVKEWGPHSSKTIHLVSSAMQQIFADRAKYLGDTDFVQVPVKGLTSKQYARSLREKISLKKANKSLDVLPGTPMQYESSETIHFSIMDRDGTVVSSTQTINGWFGSGVMVEGTGILLNNEMDDFSAKVGDQNIFGAVGGPQNLVTAKKRPLSSMSPTIVFKNHRPILALGSPAGTKILTCVALTLMNYFIHQLPLFESVAAIRYHHQWFPDEIKFSEEGLSEKTLKELHQLGHKTVVQDLGCRVQAVAYERGQLHGVSDPRGEGMAKGL